MKKLLIYIVYALVTLLYIPVTIINLILVMIKYRKTMKVSVGNYINEELREIDIFAGHSFRTTFNILFVDTEKDNSYKFGTHKRETISSTLGKNQQNKTLTKKGIFVVMVLDKIDKDHCLKAVDSHVRRGEVYVKDAK